MCIPIELDVPVLTLDQCEVGTAREIVCSCPGDSADSHDAGSICASGDLWLRVVQPGRSDLYIPFSEILETRSDGVRLRANESDLARHAWELPPPGLKLPALA